MNIVVLGAGRVGVSIAEILCSSRHNVTIVDVNPERIRALNEVLDIRVICGSAAEASTLFQAGVMNADLLLAVTGSDEVNMIGASISKAMGTRRCIARVYTPVFRDLSTFDYHRHFNIDRMVSLEHLTAMELARFIKHSGDIAAENFVQGELEVTEFIVPDDAACLNTPLKELKLPGAVRVGTIVSDGEMRLASADDQIRAGDKVTVIGAHEDIDNVRLDFQEGKTSKITVVIGGGGETGAHLARMLPENLFRVVLMDEDLERCNALASKLPHVTVVNRDANDKSNLDEERVGMADIFVACTGDDENNIMACVEAKELGTDRVFAIVTRPDYANVVGKLGIEQAVSPRKVMTRQILGFLSMAPIISKIPLGDGAFSILELEVEADVPATEHVLSVLELPKECLIAAVTRDEFSHVPRADERLRAGDAVVMLVKDDILDKAVSFFKK